MPNKLGETSKAIHASSNWLALKKTLSAPIQNVEKGFPRKRQKLVHSSGSPAPSKPRPPFTLPPPAVKEETQGLGLKNGESLPVLRDMISGNMEFSDSQQLPGKYLSLDCEMVGVGIEGSESSLARVSLVNYHGAIQLDEFVRQREQVIDYRTQYSGIRASDMAKAKPFEEVQKQVAELLKDRILVGHAVHNDLKALLLTHSRSNTRDTQYYAWKFKLSPSKYVALRNLVRQELDVGIQGGEHSSVTDARATMAVYRLHRKDWEKGIKHLNNITGNAMKKRKRIEKSESEAEDGVDGNSLDKTIKVSKAGRKGVSSGLTTVIRRPSAGSSGNKVKWWKELPGSSAANGAKGSMRLNSDT